MGVAPVSGTLRAIGVGPGDPELLTMKAHRLIGAADVVAWPRAPGTTGFAREIACSALRPGVIEAPFDVPMTTERAPAQAAYDAAAEALATHLSAGRDVAMLCEGDPLFYGSAMYLLARLAGRFPTETVPGVSSLGAVAAAAARPLAARNESFCILPGPLPSDRLRPLLAGASAVALVKVGRHLARLRGLLEDAGMADGATYVERASLAAQRVLPLSQAPDPAPYFSMILARRETDPWLR